MSNLRHSCHKIAMYLFMLCIILACSNDIDILTDAVLNEPATSIEERQNSAPVNEEEPPAESSEENTEMEDDFESRTTVFPPIEDAYVQSGKGYDQTIIRLDENNRTSYLKFDLTPIDDIGGYITDATLEFTIDSDEGSGTVEIYKGVDSDWTEQEIDNVNVPEIDILLGSITKEFKIGNTEEVILSGSDILPESTSLVLQHKEGNDLAIASKENPSRKGPKLKVKYNAPKSANAIVIVEEEPAPPPAEEEEEEAPEETPPPAQNEAPIAIADATPSGGQVPLVVTFTGNNSTDDNAIASYSWNFDDGSTASTANPTHTYSVIGTFSAVLTVTDAEGLSSTDEVTITVSEEPNSAPEARVSASVTSGNAPLQVSFTGSNSTDDNAIASYAWNFKDGGSSNNANPSHTFNSAGTYAVELTVTDENGLSDKATVSITVNEPPSNEAPVARVSATPLSGTAPLQVTFTGSNSSDDNAIASYSWNFKDGNSSNNTNPTHTFNNAGTYAVELTVTDEDGLTDKANVTITVNQPVSNEAPVAVASANLLSGDAPLQVNFTGSNSTDDNGITSYFWDFPGNPSSSANATRTFNNPGVYDISLTVTDAAGLTDTDNLTITVNQGGGGNPSGGQIPCGIGGGKANETGAKVWCWDQVPIPAYDSKTVSFSNGELGIDNECNVQVSNAGNNRLRFYINPTSPAPKGWCNNSFNMRAELMTRPWQVDHAPGTEEWFGFSYTFGNSYKIDNTSNWLFWQVHDGTVGASPLLSLQLDGRSASPYDPGEIVIVNASQPIGNNSNSIYGTNVVPVAGQTLNIVMHVIWGDDGAGLWQVWIDGVLKHNVQSKTIRSAQNVGGNAKFGIYYSPWRNQSGVNASAAAGVTEIETFLGPLRIITRRPGDADYGKDSFSEVSPN